MIPKNNKKIYGKNSIKRTFLWVKLHSILNLNFEYYSHHRGYFIIKMAPQGSGNAIVVSILVLLGMLLHCENVWAATYAVGDDNGWDFDVDTWPNGKTFRAGDVLGKHEPLFLLNNCILFQSSFFF